MEFSDVIKKRYSVRGFLDKEVEKEKLDYILEAARKAPTGVNYQPFKVFVFDTKKNKEILSKIYPQSWFLEAPIALCVVVDKDKAWTRNDGKNISDIDGAIVMDHMILAATDLGLGSCYIGAFNEKITREFLNLKDSEEAILFTPIGYPNAEPRDTPRKAIDEFVTYL